jgi:hypothetical protein
MLTRALVEPLVIHIRSRTRQRTGRYSRVEVTRSIDPSATLRGAACGAAAAAVWALQQPLDKRLFASRFDDVELLGRAVRDGDGWYAAGMAMHVANGAAFGAVYARLAPRLPLAPALRGPAVALAENFASWPLTALTDRLHPARERLPKLSGNRRALAQATWRHLLFGILLGELERRANPPLPEGEPQPEAAPYSSNGHGSLERALSVEHDA